MPYLCKVIKSPYLIFFYFLLISVIFGQAVFAQLPDQNADSYALDESLASPQIRAKLEALRKNIREKGYSFRVGYNPAMERPMSELCGLVVPPDWQKDVSFLRMDATAEPLPSSFDWRDYGGLTDVRDQGSCGSCWAFSVVAPLESQIKMKCGTDTNLSEQYLISCIGTDFGYDYGCRNGGWFNAHYYHQWYGAVLESEVPYQARDTACGGPYYHPYNIDSWFYIGSSSGTPSVDEIKRAIYTYGPISAAVCVGDAFTAYDGGIFQQNEVCLGQVNHAIVLTGWNDTGGYWILRNSWGPYWGENGYMRIKYGISKVGFAANYIEFSGCESGPATGATLNVDPKSPQVAGATVTFTAKGMGGTGTYEYRFWLYGPATGNTWQVVQDYSTSDNWTWYTTAGDTGANTVSVWVRSAGSTSSYETGTGTTYQINSGVISPATGGIITSSPASPATSGTAVNVTAIGTGGTGFYEYRFWLYGPATANTWQIVQEYSSLNTWTWHPTNNDAGTNIISVWVRNQGSANNYESGTGMYFQVNPGAITPATGAFITASPSGSAANGATVSFNAGGLGGSGSYEYRFWLLGPSTGNNWTIMQDYSSLSSWTWQTTNSAIGSNIISVWVRSAGSNANYEAGSGMYYTIW